MNSLCEARQTGFPDSAKRRFCIDAVRRIASLSGGQSKGAAESVFYGSAGAVVPYRFQHSSA